MISKGLYIFIPKKKPFSLKMARWSTSLDDLSLWFGHPKSSIKQHKQYSPIEFLLDALKGVFNEQHSGHSVEPKRGATCQLKAENTTAQISTANLQWKKMCLSDSLSFLQRQTP